jgi:hypothetical protein
VPKRRPARLTVLAAAVSGACVACGRHAGTMRFGPGGKVSVASPTPPPRLPLPAPRLETLIRHPSLPGRDGGEYKPAASDGDKFFSRLGSYSGGWFFWPPPQANFFGRPLRSALPGFDPAIHEALRPRPASSGRIIFSTLSTRSTIKSREGCSLTQVVGLCPRE